jgi:VIT1/CCC1 family predicted Fe2+/Mn2+ transporter
LTVVALILPYILLTNAIAALVTMLGIIVLIIAGFTYYTSVAQDLKFGTRFLEMAGISIAVSVISFGVGILAKQLFGIDV